MLAIIGAVRPEIVYPGVVSVSPLAENPTTSYEKFRTAYREAIIDPEFDAYVRSKLPSSIQVMEGYNPDFTFDPEPRSWALLLYDAVTSLGIAFCRAQNKTTDGQFTGKDVYNEFKMLNVEGVTGQVKIIADTGTRDYTTLTFTMFNFQQLDELDDNGMAQYKMVPTSVYTDGSWKNIDGRSFTYANGGTSPPQSLPEPQVDSNYIGDKGRIVGYSLMGVVMLCSISAIGWTVIYQSEPVVNSSQPLFLVMVAFGSLIMSSTIIPLSLEEPISVKGLDISCMAAPWLYLLGYLLAFSALFAKTRRMDQIFRNTDLDIITVTELDIFGAFLFFFLINATVLVTWTLVAPLQWTRGLTDSTDLFDRPVESYGRCASHDSVAFISVLLALNFTILAVSNWWACRARNIETEYDESRYIGISMASVLQAWSMGIPILIVVDHNPQAKFFVATGIIFVTAMALLSLIFIPKMYAIKKDRLRAEEERKLAAFKSFRGRIDPDFLRHDDAGPNEDSAHFDDVDNDGTNPAGIIFDTALSRSATENVKPDMGDDESSTRTNGLADVDESVAVGRAAASKSVESSDEGRACRRLSRRSSSAPNVTANDFEQLPREKKQSTSLRTVFKRGSLVHTLQISMSNLIPSSNTSTALASAGIRVLHNPLVGKKVEEYCCSELEFEHTQEVNAQLQCEKEAFETIAAAMDDQVGLDERVRG
jgi:7 transmembrane sweet-taste receptor of 3 GCPR